VHLVRIGVVQTGPVFGEWRRNLDDAFNLMEEQPADVWVLPEFFASGYQFVDAQEVSRLAEPIPDGSTTRELAAFCRAHDCHVVGGIPEAAPDGPYNSAVLVGPDGYVSSYRKIHLFGLERGFFRPGDRPFSVSDADGIRIGMMICFDHLFPESARSLALLGADLIAHPSNLVIPGLGQKTTAVRALENGVFVATANRVGREARGDKRELRYTGESQIVDPDGAVLVRLSSDRAEAAVVEIEPSRARDKSLNAHNDKLADRRPHLYTLDPAA
jgi:predicted amidohydrolase